MEKYFITGIGTGVGKTFVSAVLTEALKADYWKPIQCGFERGTDRQIVESLVSNTSSVFHEEEYCFKEAVSPHLAAYNEDVSIVLESFEIPETQNKLIIEGAGGILVPMNKTDYMIDLARFCEAEIILVCSSYIGCINHSLLSIDYLLKNDVPVKGIILNGNFETEVKKAIMNYAEVPVLAEFSWISELSKETVKNIGENVNLNLLT